MIKSSKINLRSAANDLLLSSALLFCTSYLGLIPTVARASVSIESLLGAATNCPPIEHLMIEARFAPNTQGIFYEYRYHKSAFFARILAGTNSQSFVMVTSRGAGRWQDDYWSYESNQGQRVLTTYRLDQHRGSSSPYLEAERLQHWLSYYTGLGISGDGVNSLTWDGTNLKSRSPHGWITTLAIKDLIFSNGMPTEASVKRYINPDVTTRFRITYKYDTNVAPLPFPAVISAYEGPSGDETWSYTLTVLRMKLADAGSVPSLSSFFPDVGGLSSNIVRVVYTNGHNYQLLGGKLLSMSGDERAERKMLRKPGVPPSYVRAGLIIIALLLPLVAVWAIRKHTNKTNKPTHI